MLALFVIGAFSAAEDVAAVEKMISQQRYRQAHDTAAMYIRKAGILDADPKLFFLKGKCAYQIGNLDDAIKDMSRFITSGSATAQDKKAALEVRGKSRLRLGLFDDALSDSKLASNRTLTRLISACQAYVADAETYENSEQFTKAIEEYEKVLKTAISAVKIMIKAAKCALKAGDVDKFSTLSHQAMQIAPKDPELLEMRGKFFLCDGNTDMAARHFKICRTVASDDTSCTILFKASNNFAEQYKMALNKTTKKEFTGVETYIEQCEAIAEKRCPAGSQLGAMASALRAKVLIGTGKPKEAMRLLNKLIDENPNATELLLERADLYLKQGDLDMAMKDYQDARNVSPNNKRANEGVDKVAKLQEAEKNVDFYEVLGLRRGASNEEIKAAYRKAVREWHPDRYSDPIKKRDAEKKMKNINRAMDVLGDEKKKRLYDAGVDPDNEGAQQQQHYGHGFGGNGFHQEFHFGGGGFPFGDMFGGGRGFQFHFR